MARLRWLIIPVFAILLMSHNANALSFGDATYINFSIGNTIINVTNNEYTSYDLPSSQMSDLNAGLNISIPTNTIRVNNIHLGFSSNTPNKYLASVAYRFCPNNPDNLSSWIGFSGSSRNSVISQKWIINGSCLSGDVLVYGDTARSRIDLGLGSSYGVNIGYIAAGGTIVFNSVSIVTLTDDADYSSVLNAIKNNTDDIKTKLDEIADSADAALDREQSATQEQSEAGDSAADSSTDAVEGATQNLFSAMGSIVNAVKDTPATNCLIDISTTGNSSAFTSSIGSINLCADVPSNILNMIRGLAALVIVPYVLYACYSICIKMYRTFTEVQNT